MSSSASSRPLSFREEAEARASRLHSEILQESTPLHPMQDWRLTTSSNGQSPSAASPLHPLQDSEWRSASPQQHTSPSSFSSPSSLLHSISTTATSASTDARQEWRRHGAGLSQLLEEKRNCYGSYPGCYVVRIVSAESRVDLSGATYTAYLVRVSTTSSDYLVEHRYSDFGKLQQVLDQSRITVEATFPSKHWAGRLGNWTPSLTWAPDQHDDLIQYRKIQLDVWLVHVVYLYNQQQQLPSTNSKQFTSSSSASYLPQIVQNAIYDFLQPAQKLPCDQIHDWALASPQNNSSSTTLKSLWEQAKWNNPLSFTLGSSIRQAVTTIHYMCHSSCSQQQRHNDYIVHNNNNNDDDYYSQQQQRWQESDASIPLDLLHAAKGLMFLTVVKAGLVVSGRLGTGLIVAKLDEESLPIGTPTHHRPTSPDATTTSTSTSRWSAPCALGTLGMGWGALAGGDVTHYLIVFTSQKAVQAMVGGSSVQFGAEVDVAVGPMGRGATSHVSASHHDWSLHPAYAYAHSQGFFAGISLEGSFVAVRPEVNAKFYGQATTDALAILQRPGVNAAVPLYQALDQALGLDIPSRGIRPSQIWSSPPTAWSVPPTPTQQHCHQQPNGPFMSSPIMSPSVPGTFNNMITSTMSTPVQSNGNYNAHSQWNAHTI